MQVRDIILGHFEPKLTFISRKSIDLCISGKLNPIQDGLFWVWSGMLMAGHEVQKAPLSKICHSSPGNIKIFAVIPYLKKT